MHRERIKLAVYVDLDPVPGTHHTGADARYWLNNLLHHSIPHYNPEVLLEPTRGHLLTQLELALHEADCPGHDKHFEGHGDKYTKMAIAAASVFPPEREPYWLVDRKLVQESALNFIVDRLNKIEQNTAKEAQ